MELNNPADGFLEPFWDEKLVCTAGSPVVPHNDSNLGELAHFCPNWQKPTTCILNQCFM